MTKIADPNQYTVAIGGVPAYGYANGEFLTIAYDNPDFLDEVGTDGEVSVSPSADRRATIELKLMQTSDYNDYLSGINQVQIRTKGVGLVSVLIKDRNGRSLHQAAEAWVNEKPGVSLDRGPKERVWRIRCAALLSFHGGN